MDVLDLAVSGPKSLKSIRSTLAMTSIKQPTPAAHFSLTVKLVTIPSSFSRITLVD
jgi:hypothetical protein